MDERPEVYELETIEQLRAIADPLRLRIVELIAESPMTVTQVGEALGVPANKAHYHVRELERVGVVRIVETREKSGILEKYFQTVARGLSVPKALLSQAPPDESIAAATEVLQSVVHNFLTAFSHVVRTQDWDTGSINLEITDLWMSPQELREASDKIREILKPFQNRRSEDGVKRISFLRLAHPALESLHTAERDSVASQSFGESHADASSHVERTLDPTPHARGMVAQGSVSPDPGSKPRPVIVAGSVSYSRDELEELVAAGRRVDLNVLGLLSFSPDVSAELVEQAIGHVRHRGVISASPEVKAVLTQKGAKL